MATDKLTLKVLDLEGKPTKDVVLDPKIFGVKTDVGLLHLVTTAYQANKRLGLAHTKTKGEVRGGGRKPWKQKGTGQARQGSIRSPQWRGGGITFGPRTGSNHTRILTQKVKCKALAMALSTMVDKHHLILVEKFPSEGKTKPVAQLLKKLNANRLSLIAPASHDNLLVRATRNMPNVEVLRADSLNTYDVLRARHLILPVDSLEVIAKTFFTKK
jgi:large subunit ribosomal protein L4